ncbi:MAG: hypothetical protein HYZ14_04745 [Bacteroidetes bacterium]|nr:hypothetical protein [Bacteroidota bacterium]
MQKLPDIAKNFVHTHFQDGNVQRVEEKVNLYGHTIYGVSIHCDDIIYYVEFNEKGDLVSYDTKPFFEDDYFEGGFYGSSAG